MNIQTNYSYLKISFDNLEIHIIFQIVQTVKNGVSGFGMPHWFARVYAGRLKK